MTVKSNGCPHCKAKVVVGTVPASDHRYSGGIVEGSERINAVRHQPTCPMVLRERGTLREQS